MLIKTPTIIKKWWEFFLQKITLKRQESINGEIKKRYLQK